MQYKDHTVTWHVFADNRDYWFDTLSEAKKCYKSLKKEGYYDRRIYKTISEIDGDFIDESLHTWCGAFPN